MRSNTERRRFPCPRSNTEGRHYPPPRMFHSEMYCPRQRCGNALHTTSERCLMTEFNNVVEKLYSSCRGNSNLRTLPEYFKDILYSASGLNWEFRKLEDMFSMKLKNSFCHLKGKCPSLDDMVYLHQAAKSLLALIESLKADLMFQEHCTNTEGRRSLFQTKTLVSELETKLHDLLNKVDQFKMKLSSDCFNNGCKNNHFHKTCPMYSNEPKSQNWTKNLNIPIIQRYRNVYGRGDFSSGNAHPCLQCNSSSTGSRPGFCSTNKFNENCTDKMHNDLNLKIVSIFEHPTRDMSSQSQHCYFKESQAEKTPFKKSSNPKNHHFSQTPEQILRTILLEDKNMTHLHTQQPLNALYSSPCTARRDQHHKTVQKPKRVMSVTQKYSDSDVEQRKKKGKRSRSKRTRAGKDHVRLFRSHSNQLKNQNEEYKNIYNMNEYYQRNDNFERMIYNSNSSSVNGSYNEVGNNSDVKNNKDACSRFWLGTLSEPQDDWKRQWGQHLRPRSRSRHQLCEGEPRLVSGANRHAFSINKSMPRHRTLRRKVQNKKRRRYARRRPSLISVDSSKPRKRNIGRRKRKVSKRVAFSRPRSKYMYRQEKERKLGPDIERRIRLMDEYTSQYSIGSNVYPFECDECCSCCPPPVEKNVCECCPTDCTYTCCVPRDYCNYRSISYPMCSNTCCSEVSPVLSETFCVEFERPRKKRIVKKYIQPKRTQRVESQWISENYVESKESINSYKIIRYKPPPPSKTKSKYYKFYRESREKVIDYGTTASNETTVTLSRGTSTENLSTSDVGTSTYEVIKAVKAVATNTPKSSTRDFGVNSIPQRRPRPIKTESKSTNTEKMRSRTIGTDAKPIVGKQNVRMTNKATDPPVLYKKHKETNTTPEKKKNLKDTGTNPKPEQNKPTKSIGTDALKQKLQSKATNTIPVKELSRPKPVTVSRGTVTVPLSTKVKQTSYDKVKTREDGTNPVKTAMKDKGQQYNYEPKPIISEVKITQPNIGNKQVLRSQRLEHIQISSKQQKENLQILSKQPVAHPNKQYLTPQSTDYPQILTKQTAQNRQIITKELPEYRLVSSKQPEERRQIITRDQPEYHQEISKQPAEYGNITEKQPLEYGQIITKQPAGDRQVISKQQREYGQVISKEPTEYGHITGKKPSEYCQMITKQPAGDRQVISNQQRGYCQVISKQPTEYGHIIGKQPPEYCHILGKQPPGYCHIIGKQPTEYGHIAGKQPTGDHQSISKQQREYRQVISKQPTESGHITEKQPPEYCQIIGKQPPGYCHIIGKQPKEQNQWICSNEPEKGTIIKDTSSEMSMHLTVEKIHEEVFRKKCRFCKCMKKCKCKCCNGRGNNKKIVVCEKKKSNTVRITNKSDCNISLMTGEEIATDIDIDLGFKIASSASTIYFNSDDMQERPMNDIRSSELYDGVSEQDYNITENGFYYVHSPDVNYGPDLSTNNTFIDSEGMGDSSGY